MGMMRRQSGKTALIVDDEPLLAMELTVGFQELGCANVIVSKVPSAASTLLDSGVSVDLAVLELVGGPECLHLAQRLLRMGALVLFTSAISRPMPILAGGIAVPVLEKPYRFEEIAGAFDRLVEEKV